MAKIYEFKTREELEQEYRESIAEQVKNEFLNNDKLCVMLSLSDAGEDTDLVIFSNADVDNNMNKLKIIAILEQAKYNIQSIFGIEIFPDDF